MYLSILTSRNLSKLSITNALSYRFSSYLDMVTQLIICFSWHRPWSVFRCFCLHSKPKNKKNWNWNHESTLTCLLISNLGCEGRRVIYRSFCHQPDYWQTSLHHWYVKSNRQLHSWRRAKSQTCKLLTVPSKDSMRWVFVQGTNALFPKACWPPQFWSISKRAW